MNIKIKKERGFNTLLVPCMIAFNNDEKNSKLHKDFLNFWKNKVSTWASPRCCARNREFLFFSSRLKRNVKLEVRSFVEWCCGPRDYIAVGLKTILRFVIFIEKNDTSSYVREDRLGSKELVSWAPKS